MNEIPSVSFTADSSLGHYPALSPDVSTDVQVQAAETRFAITASDRGFRPTRQTDTRPASYFRIKSGIDRLLTAALMIVALPLMLLVSLAVLLADGRPVFYRQIRVGRRGRLFRIWKFRSMQHQAERETGAVWSNAGDPRVTRLGRWLRRTHLDELPQVLNVLAGEMNLVGPRPERPEFVRELAREMPDYMGRTLVRPGITGLSQLRLGYDHSVAGVRQKVASDLKYIRKASFWGDVRLLVSTVPYIAGRLLFNRSAQQPADDGRSSANPGSAIKLIAPPRRLDQPANRGDQNRGLPIPAALERRA